jgi:HD-GYP domain-containing protein (c-di-GMP phosphodiesterase class II)
MRVAARGSRSRAVRRRGGNERALQPLLRATELVDAGAGHHLEQVGHYSGVAARALGLAEPRSRAIASACRLHDIGKLGVPDEILLKPGALNEPERKLMERHSTIGHRILADSGTSILDLAASIALTHHEWYDGRGYPQGLAGDTIPHAEAARILREAAGSQFDPDVVSALLDSLELDDVSRPGEP